MRIERGIGWFDTENEAIEAAQQWAFGWIGRRDGSVVGNAGDPPVPGRDASAGTY
jgi:hypothetical protein